MNAPAQAVPSTALVNPKRRRALFVFGAVLLVAAIGWAAYWLLYARYFESTDNAYVSSNVIQITPQVGGTVLAINAQDTDFVKAGQPLVRLDPADAQVALDQAEADLARVVREVRTLYTSNGTFAANIALREADVKRAEADVAKARDDLDRRQGLAASGAVSNEEIEHARTALASATSALAAAKSAVVAAQEQLAANKAQTDGTTVEQHPNVQRAAARVREAWLALSRAELVAPATGYVAKRSVQVGQRVAAGTPLMSVIPLDEVWVDANFKESQLARMRIGQPVKLTADLYGNRVEYDGHIVGLGAGTGAAFALLPAQNATGNWIKVVQRVPVRVALDPKQLAEHPLRVGLSMEADVDLHDQSGKALSDVPRVGAASKSDVIAIDDARAGAIVDRIIAENLGRKPAVPNGPLAARHTTLSSSTIARAS